jgi:ADP-ribose pyrophosphatase YjhB (NUDIX family)
MLPQPLTQVSSIIMDNGKVLIGRSNGGKWETPTADIMPFEGIKEAAARAVVMSTGVVSDPQNVIFVSEVLKQREAEHKVLIYLFSKYISGGENFIFEGDWAEALWVDVRELAEYQDAMTDETVDAFYKFSMILRQSAARSGAQA